LIEFNDIILDEELLLVINYKYIALIFNALQGFTMSIGL